jgi:hypothetical protein
MSALSQRRLLLSAEKETEAEMEEEKEEEEASVEGVVGVGGGEGSSQSSMLHRERRVGATALMFLKSSFRPLGDSAAAASEGEGAQCAQAACSHCDSHIARIGHVSSSDRAEQATVSVVVQVLCDRVDGFSSNSGVVRHDGPLRRLVKLHVCLYKVTAIGMCGVQSSEGVCSVRPADACYMSDGQKRAQVG